MEDFQFWNPTRIVFGKNVLHQVGTEIKYYDVKKILLLYGQGSVKKNNVYDLATRSLMQQKIDYIEFPGVKSNPLLSDVRKAIKVCKEHKVEAILALGGGSVIDSAKAVAAGIEYKGDVWDLFTGQGYIEDAMPIFTVLTISASSSEMNPCAVLTNDHTREKYAISSAALFPDISFIDPQCQFTVPKDYVAYSSVDAISHLIEIFFNCAYYPSLIQNQITYTLIKTIMTDTEKVLAEPQNYETRADLIWSILLSYNGLVTAGRGFYYFPCHVLEHSLSALYSIPHGAGLSILLPAWMKWENRYRSRRIADLFENVFGMAHAAPGKTGNAGEEGIRKFKAWCRQIGAPVSLEHYNIELSRDFPEIMDNMNIHIHQSKLQDELTPEVLKEIIEYAR